ncbi:MAG: 16S rRNA m(5)C967 methyltransferase [Arenicellales bacterium IbO2]|nr:MAG: 16S rRNA m(5)C967 methyltransferase [Arenicellales bacterium IbO2]
MNMNAHLAAARAVMEVVDCGRSLEAALAAHAPEVKRRAWLREVAAGGCRHYHRFDAMLAQLMKTPLKSRDRAVHFLLVNACHQIEHMRVPDHAALSESVEAVKGTRFDWAGGLINAVLRNFLRARESLQGGLGAAARAAFPDWLHREIRMHWPEQCGDIFAASNCKPPLTLRVNRLKTGRDEYLGMLARAGVGAAPTADSAVGVTLDAPLPAEEIPGFAAGLASVQDEAAQLVAPAAAPELRAGGRVLDGCAAPGGKTCLLLEAQPQLRVTAVDLPERIGAVEQNLARLGLSAEVVAADLREDARAGWARGRSFDLAIVDAPCSGSGVIRRHPDIKHRRRAADIARFAEQQSQLLARAWELLADGASLLYVTCSILPAENDAVIAGFVAAHSAARAERPAAPHGIETEFGVQRLPGVHAGDGFYYCRLKKTSPKTSAKTSARK